jgi:Na+-driven multidrug efflux pump
MVGQAVGSNGVAAINITIPLMNIFTGLALMIAFGSSVAISIHLSQGKEKAARYHVAQSILFLGLITSISLVLIQLFTESISLLLGSSVTLLLQVVDYLRYFSICWLPMVIAITGMFIIRIDGSPKYAMWCNIVPAILNVILDYIFIFPLEMGVKGAAIATTLAQSTGGFMALYYIIFRAKSTKPLWPKMSLMSIKLSIRNICYQIRVGFSAMLGELTLGLLTLIGNLQFMKYMGDAGVGAFGIACYYLPFLFLTGSAIVESAQPIISYNYGSGDRMRVKSAYSLAIKTAAGTGIALTAIFVLFPEFLMRLFISADSAAYPIGVKGFPLLAIGFTFFMINLVVIGYYQSIERPIAGITISITRGIILLIPSFIILPELLGADAIWLANPITEIATLIIFFVIRTAYRYRSNRKKGD